jgi:hypothetical protein
MKQFNLETQAWEEEGEEGAVSSLELLQAIYRDCKQPLSVRMRAATVTLPFEVPKLSAVAVMNGDDFGSRLDAAIARGHGEMKVIEHRAGEVVEHDPSELER